MKDARPIASSGARPSITHSTVRSLTRSFAPARARRSVCFLSPICVIAICPCLFRLTTFIGCHFCFNEANKAACNFVTPQGRALAGSVAHRSCGGPRGPKSFFCSKIVTFKASKTLQFESNCCLRTRGFPKLIVVRLRLDSVRTHKEQRAITAIFFLDTMEMQLCSSSPRASGALSARTVSTVRERERERWRLD